MYSNRLKILSPQFLFIAFITFFFGAWLGYYWDGAKYNIKQNNYRYVKQEQQPNPKFVKSRTFGQVKQKTEKVVHNNFHFEISKPVVPQNINKVQAINVNVPSKCFPRNNIMFMKTHKTASTAMQNIFFRYAIKNDLEVAMSSTNDIRFHYGQLFKKEFVRPSKRPINIICHHMVYNYEEVQKVMSPDAIYITILRETSSLFESLFDYMHWDCPPFAKVKKRPRSLEYWLNNTSTFFKGNIGHFSWFAKNSEFFDLGYDNLNEDETYINSAIKQLDKQFHLVLLSDYFEESIILLKDILCWDMEDVLYLKTNARSQSTNMSESVVQKIRKWNKADTMMYDYFNKSFWRKVEEYGKERMENDIKRLKLMNKNLLENCVDGDAVSNRFIKDQQNKVYNPPGVDMKGYNIKQSARGNATCENLLKGEIQITRELSRKQRL